MGKRLGSSLLLLLTAVIWGSAFVAQRSGMDSVGPFTFLAARSVLTVAALSPLALPRLRKLDRRALPRTLLGGFICGAALFLGSGLQQWGLVTTTAGKAGFLTALYIVFVPLGKRLFGQRIGLRVWLSVALAAGGLYCLCAAGESAGFRPGDLLLLSCAVMFAVHILTVDRLGPALDSILLSYFQFLTCAVLAWALAFCLETPAWSGLKRAWLPIAYAGLLSGAVGYTLQIVAQKHADPTVASLLMSLESVFSALAGWILLREALSAWELLGCALVFAAVILSQLPQKPASVPFSDQTG